MTAAEVIDAKAPSYGDEAVPVVDLWTMLETGSSCGLTLGRSQPTDASAILGEPTGTEPLPPASQGLRQSFDHVHFDYGAEGRLDAIVANSISTQLLIPSPPDTWPGPLVDIHASAGALRLNGWCVTKFGTLPQLIERLPPHARIRLDAAAWDRAILIRVFEATRCLSMSFRLQVVEASHMRGRFEADYFLTWCRIEDAAPMPESSRVSGSAED